MTPALAPGDRLLVDRAEYRTKDPHVGEIVVLRDPEDRRRWLVKRVAATAGQPIPGDRVPGDDERVPPDCVFVLSDRVRGTRDSRRFGSVALGGIIGRAWYRTAPRERRGPLPP